MQKRRKWIAGLIIFYTVFGFLIAPPIIKSIATRQLKQHLHRDVSIRQVRLNPYALSLTINDLNVKEPDGTTNFFGWSHLYVNFQLSSLFLRSLVFREITLTNFYAHGVVKPDRTLNISDLLTPSLADTNPPAKPPTIRIGTLRIAGGRIACEDHSRQTPFTTVIGPIDVTLQKFSTRPDNQNPYSFTATTEAGEKFAWRGAFHLDPIRSHGDFAIEQIALPKYAPYLDQFPHLHIRDGRLGVRGTYQVDLTPGANVAILTNTVITLNSLRLAERSATNDAVVLDNLTVTNLFADALAQRLEIGAVHFTGERLHVAIRPDRSLNLLNLFAAAPTTNTAPAAPPRNLTVSVGSVISDDGIVNLTGVLGDQALSWQHAALTNIQIQTVPLMASVTAIAFTNAALTHTDAAVQPAAHVNVQQINGLLTGFSLETNSVAQFQVACKYNNIAPITLAGSLTPVTLARGDVKILFQEVSLLPLDPYAGQFLGYRLDSGSLSLDLKYTVNQRQLDAQNVITMDQLNLGEATGSTNALNLPVKLGLAILKDRHGVIKLDVPITGSFDDPQFKLRKVILQTLKNLFLRILTSPFAALGSMFGGGGDELGYQEFLPGQTELQPAEAKKLDVLLKALQERPALKLEIHGAFDNVKDLDGLRRAKLNQLLTTTPLRDVYLANLDKLRATIIVTNETTATPTGFSNVTGVIPKTARVKTGTIPTARREAALTPPAEMEKQLLQIMEVAPEELQQLAAARATAVHAYLMQAGSVEAERMVIGDPSPKSVSCALLSLK